MIDSPSPQYYTHPVDILGFLIERHERGENVALAVVTDTSGGGIRTPGAFMAVTQAGEASGYVSNGCVDADIIFQAQEALTDKKPRVLIYGEGSPFADVRLPCGGRLGILVLPAPDIDMLKQVRAQLSDRQAVPITFGMEGVTQRDPAASPAPWDGQRLCARLLPRMRLRIAGRGTEPVALARLARASDIEVFFQSPDEEAIGEARALGIPFMELTNPEHPPEATDDAYTAFILMFHDHDWELGLLMQALAGEAFYIGALGSRKTHARRCEALQAAGASEADLSRIHAPIGLVPHVREANLLAISALAEVASAWQCREA